uniref:Uncharacterized protein n=1 Tax=Ascaris lumbricoides TaxID=6252 RepID=A0A9J2P4Q6_ASCLU
MHAGEGDSRDSLHDRDWSRTSYVELVVGGKSQGADGATRLEIEYETVEVLTPETWNRFANLEKREMANLFVENRIPSQTEKVLCEIGYDMGRITRNKLKSVLEDSPSAATMTPSPRSPKSRRGGRTRKTIVMSLQLLNLDVFLEPKKLLNLSSWILASLQIETVTEQGEDLLNREEQSLQSEQSQSAARRAKNRTGSRGQASRGRSIRAAAARGWHSPRAAENGKTRGARRGQRSRSTITLTKAAQLSLTDPEVMTVNAVKLVLTTSAKEEEGVSSASSVLPDEAGGEVVEKTDGAASSEQPVEDIEANVTQASSQKLLIHKKRSFAGEVGDDMGRNEFSRKRLKSETAGQQQPPFYAGEANAEVNERSAFEKESFTSGAVQTANESIPILQTGTVSTSMLAIPKTLFVCDLPSAVYRCPSQVYSQYGLASMKRSDQLKNPVFRELEELPLPISTNAVVQTESNRFRRHLLNRGPPFKNFQALRSAVLEGHLAGVRWTARCFAEKRGYDFNQSFRGKTLISELCERKCNTWSSPHELEDMLRMLVIGGARLDVPEEHRLRMPLHTAVETGSWCLVRALLYLRSPVNVCDASEKTPLHLVVQNSDPATVRAIYLLLQFGADVNDVLKTVRNSR